LTFRPGTLLFEDRSGSEQIRRTAMRQQASAKRLTEVNEMTESTKVTTRTSIDPEFFRRYQQAWEDHDNEAIVSMMTPDGVYEASIGPKPWGERYVGRDEIRQGIGRMATAMGNAPSQVVHYEQHLFDNCGFSMWTSSYTDAQGRKVSVHGCDFYEFRDGLVSKKIAYRKSSKPEYQVNPDD
jgi:ketosteroid isomerase-like protein